MRLRALFLAAFAAAACASAGLADPGPTPATLRAAVAARIDPAYAVVLFSDGHRSMLPLTSLNAADRAWLEKLAADHPLGHGNSTVIVAKTVLEKKKTLEKATVEGPLETPSSSARPPF